MARFVRILCKISRSAFSDERVFRIAAADGAEHVGAASVMYFSKGDDQVAFAGRDDLPLAQPERGPASGLAIFAHGFVIHFRYCCLLSSISCRSHGTYGVPPVASGLSTFFWM